MHKTTLLFSTNNRVPVREQIQRVAGVTVYDNFEKYLGLPVMVGRFKYNSFKYLKDRVWLKVNNWKNNFLSQECKEILLKVVVQGILAFSMSVFRLPSRLYKEISSIMSRFWWGFRHNDMMIHWKN